MNAFESIQRDMARIKADIIRQHEREMYADHCMDAMRYRPEPRIVTDEDRKAQRRAYLLAVARSTGQDTPDPDWY